VDGDKDQTYFLSGLSGAQLAPACFPLAGLSKARVRALARAAGLPVADKKDSTGICFVGERPFRAFLAAYVPPAPGAIVDPDGQVLGQHAGLPFYTPGQRAGLGIGGRRGAPGARWYVAGKDLAGNRLIVVPHATHPLLWARAVRTAPAHFVAGAAPEAGFAAQARIRHRGALAPCAVTVRGDGALEVRFAAPQWAPAPGQRLALYRGEECLGGAAIARRLEPVPAVAAALAPAAP
jgi:tRNA-uridine 2-sulfurtransferase